MKALTYILNGTAVALIFGFALCADSLADTCGPMGLLLRGGVALGIAGICVAVANRLEEGQKENRPVYRKYTGRRGKCKH